jgi:hypothetical protein
MATLLDNGAAGTPLGQIGQGYAGQPNLNQLQTGFSATSPFWQNAFARISQNPAFSSLSAGQSNPNAPAGSSVLDLLHNRGYLGGLQTGGQTSGMQNAPGALTFPPAAGADATSAPPSAIGGAPASGMPSLARSPANGPPFGYGQPSSMMGLGFNAAGFGGLGATGGQGPAARYWARLNSIGGS